MDKEDEDAAIVTAVLEGYEIGADCRCPELLDWPPSKSRRPRGSRVVLIVDLAVARAWFVALFVLLYGSWCGECEKKGESRKCGNPTPPRAGPARPGKGASRDIESSKAVPTRVAVHVSESRP